MGVVYWFYSSTGLISIFKWFAEINDYLTFEFFELVEFGFICDDKGRVPKLDILTPSLILWSRFG